MKYEIRKPQKKDIKQINELFEKTIKDNFNKERISDPLGIAANTEIETLKSGLKNHLKSENSEDSYLISILGDKIVGTIAYGKVSNIICENLKVDYGNTPEVKSVYVLPNYQNKGIGRNLMKNTLVDLKENNIKCFCLDSGYKRSQNYWSKRLGKPICIINDYWGVGNHHMIWYCEVSEIYNLYTS